MIEAYDALACSLYFLGDFEPARQYAMRGVQIWRSGNLQSHAQDFGHPVGHPVVGCLCYQAQSEWHLGEMASSRATMAEAISLAKELNDTSALALALQYAAVLAYFEHNPVEVDRLASDLIELATRHNFAYWLTAGAILRGWARCASGDTVEGISWIEDGIRDSRASGSIIGLPFFLTRKAEALHMADRTPEALDAINEAEALVERTGARWWGAELHRLRGGFLKAIGADESQIEASFCAAIRTAKEQNLISLAKRAEASYAEYRSQKAGALGRYGFRPEKISLARLPVSGSDVFGREEHLAFLHEAWASEHVNIVTIVAWAGVGKSTLVNHWLGQMSVEHYRSAELVFGWSFYRQGTSGGSSSADEFFYAALTWFGDPQPPIR